MRTRICFCELHAFCRQAINAGRSEAAVDAPAREIAHFSVAKIICQDEEYVRRRGCSRGQHCAQQRKGKERVSHELTRGRRLSNASDASAL